MKKLDLRTFVMLLCVASMTVFVSCDNKGNEPDDPTQGEQTEQNGSTENNGGEETPEPETPTPESPVTFTLTLLSSNETMGTVTEGGTYEKDAEVIIEATATKEAYMFVKWSDGNTENPRTLTMTENLTLTAEFDYTYVDLGLSVKWATCNVGANSPEDYGDYYAWGDIKTKSSYTSDNYSTYNVQITDISGNVQYDAATANWGGSWRMPTKDEMNELRNNCTWEWITQNGVNGYKVTGPNKNTIFLPATGYFAYSSLKDAGTEGCYWSSTDYENIFNIVNYALSLTINSKKYTMGGNDRYNGRAIRGVTE